MTLGQRIKDLRERKGLSQKELGDMIDVDRSYIGHIETGRVQMPSKEILAALANILETTKNDLLLAAGYLETPLTEEDLADPELRLYFSKLAELSPHDRRLIIDFSMPFIEEQRRKRKHRHSA